MIAAALLAAALAACPAQEQILKAASQRIEAAYVPADQAPALADDLRRWAKENRYAADCARPAVFAARVTGDLRARDQHLEIELAGKTAEDKDWLARWRAEAKAENAGVREAAVWDNGVAYLRLSSFHSWDLSERKLTLAFGLVQDGRALVLDLRRNGGGDGETADHVLAALSGPDPVRVGYLEKRSGREAVTTLGRTPLPRFGPDKPLIVLVDRRTGSAAEAVAYALQSIGRARVVGDRTIGAANLVGDSFPLPHGFLLWAPEARPINIKTGGNWERSGVQPDVPGGDDPLYTARRLAEAEIARLKK